MAPDSVLVIVSKTSRSNCLGTNSLFSAGFFEASFFLLAPPFFFSLEPRERAVDEKKRHAKPPCRGDSSLRSPDTRAEALKGAFADRRGLLSLAQSRPEELEVEVEIPALSSPQPSLGGCVWPNALDTLHKARSMATKRRKEQKRKEDHNLRGCDEK